MKRFLISFATIAVALPAGAQVRDSATTQLDAIVAIVGSTPITRYDVEQRVADSVRWMRGHNTPMPSAERRKEIVLSTLKGLIDEELLLAKAKEMKIEVSDADVTTYTDNQFKQVQAQFPSEAEFRKGLVAAGLGSPEEYRKFLAAEFRRTRTIQMLVQRLTAPGESKIPSVTVSEAQVKAEFDRLKLGGLPQRLASVLWRQLVIAPVPSAAARLTAQAKAESLHAEIKAGGDFERIAKRESMDLATKDLGGDLGWRKRGDLPEELERLVFGPFAIRPGDISAVTESPFGFHILRLDRANPPAEVKVRQILIIPKIDSSDVARAAKLADSLVTVLRAKKTPFDTLARHFHDPAEDAPGLMSDTPWDTLPPSYQNGLRGVGKDSIVAFPIPAGGGLSKFVIAQVVSSTEAGDYTYDDVKARIRSNLQQVVQMRRYIDTLRKSMYVKVMEDRALAATSVFDRGGSP
jgi:peptidyl-prolyl cis-trans isomerase SurA